MDEDKLWFDIGRELSLLRVMAAGGWTPADVEAYDAVLAAHLSSLENAGVPKEGCGFWSMSA